jgi:polyisoprenoid-binding protein YceI
MKAILTAVFLLTGLFTIRAQQYQLLDSKSEVNFTIKNFGLNTNGSFSGLKGTIKFDAQNLNASAFNVSVDANTINTGIESRDSHLKKEEYFDAEKYPTINFVSTSITRNSNGYTVSGHIIIKGVDKIISFPFTVEDDRDGLVFSGSFTLDRKDFNVGGSSAVLSNTVNVNLKVFATKG